MEIFHPRTNGRQSFRRHARPTRCRAVTVHDVTGGHEHHVTADVRLAHVIAILVSVVPSGRPAGPPLREYEKPRAVLVGTARECQPARRVRPHANAQKTDRCETVCLCRTCAFGRRAAAWLCPSTQPTLAQCRSVPAASFDIPPKEHPQTPACRGTDAITLCAPVGGR